MKTVWKFDVPVDDRPHPLPITRGSQITNVACQGDARVVHVWVVMDPGLPPAPRQLQVYGTGHAVPDASYCIGTTLAPLGLVWHVFDITAVVVG